MSTQHIRQQYCGEQCYQEPRTKTEYTRAFKLCEAHINSGGSQSVESVGVLVCVRACVCVNDRLKNELEQKCSRPNREEAETLPKAVHIPNRLSI